MANAYHGMQDECLTTQFLAEQQGLLSDGAAPPTPPPQPRKEVTFLADLEEQLAMEELEMYALEQDDRA